MNHSTLSGNKKQKMVYFLSIILINLMEELKSFHQRIASETVE